GQANGTNTADGCYLGLENGEKVINQPITFGGLTYFSTSKPVPPSANSCYRGQSTAYELPLYCRPPKSQTLMTDGLPPSPVVGYVEINGKLQPFVIGGINNKASSIEAKKPDIPIPSKRKRTYWYLDNKDR
ncbi:MAG TPA: hypothetical protein VFS42_01315, partial [Burkholderiaceae bacterium]|nr:hypothetical protein [Burkholderiaceae bacterium]